MQYQLRRFGIAAGQMDEFLFGWKKGVLPLRREQGFETIGAWVNAATNEFVWLLTYSGPGGFEEADVAYYESAARAGLDPNPADHIETVEKFFVDPVV